MIDNLDSTDSTLRRIIWDAFKSYSTDELFALILDDDCIVRTSAAKRLQLIGTKKIFDHAKSLASIESSNAREIAAFILGQLCTSKRTFKNESIPILITLSFDQNIDVRAAAIYAIGHLGNVNEFTDLELIDVLRNAVSDQNADIRQSAAFSICSYKFDNEIKDMLQLLKNDDIPSVVENARLSEEIYLENEKSGF